MFRKSNRDYYHHNWMEKFIEKSHSVFWLFVCALLMATLTIIEPVLTSVFNHPDEIQLITSKTAPLVKILLSLSAIVFVGVLTDLRARIKTIDIKASNSFPNLKNAADVIADIIINCFKESEEGTLEIRIYGRRCTQNLKILEKALEEIKNAPINSKRKIEIYIYYSAPDYLDNLKKFRSDLGDDFIKTLDHQKDILLKNIKRFKENVEFEQYGFIKDIHYLKHFDSPQFWAIKIDKRYTFWGYFKYKQDEHGIYNFTGSPNKCFFFNNGNGELEGFSRWIDNNFERLDKWAKKD